MGASGSSGTHLSKVPPCTFSKSHAHKRTTQFVSVFTLEFSHSESKVPSCLLFLVRNTKFGSLWALKSRSEKITSVPAVLFNEISFESSLVSQTTVSFLTFFFMWNVSCVALLSRDVNKEHPCTSCCHVFVCQESPAVTDFTVSITPKGLNLSGPYRCLGHSLELLAVGWWLPLGRSFMLLKSEVLTAIHGAQGYPPACK